MAGAQPDGLQAADPPQPGAKGPRTKEAMWLGEDLNCEQ